MAGKAENNACGDNRRPAVMRQLFFIHSLCVATLMQSAFSAENHRTVDFIEDPRLSGIRQYLTCDSPNEYAQDFGCIVSHKPSYVFTPPAVSDLQSFLQAVAPYKIKITCRGGGNSVYGQSQVKAGVIIDLKNLNIPLHFDSEDYSSVVVPVHKTWSDVIEFTKQQNKTVPVTIDNLDLTVGGTLSFGAVGGPSYKWGSGSDNVTSLNVVTLNGHLHVCSKAENRELFDAVLCGIGQYGIIVSAQIPLLAAKKLVSMHLLVYDNPTRFLEAQRSLYDSKIVDHLKGFVRKNNDKWEYVVEAASYYDDHEDSRVIETLAILSPGEQSTQTMPYWDFSHMVTGFVKLLRDNGKLNGPKPWYNLFVPEHDIERQLSKVLDTTYLTGSEPIIVYPMNSKHFNQPLFMKPSSEVFYLLGVLYNTSFSATMDFPYEEVLEHNKKLYLEAKKEGSCRYPVDAIPFTPDDWENHYGEKWPTACFLKKKYDPNHLLSSGVNIFT
jgi:hypothetical protein